MSLLNQVLRDLEARESRHPQMPVHWAAVTPDGRVPDTPATPAWRRRMRPGMVGLFVAPLLISAWAYQHVWQAPDVAIVETDDAASRMSAIGASSAMTHVGGNGTAEAAALVAVSGAAEAGVSRVTESSIATPVTERHEAEPTVAAVDRTTAVETATAPDVPVTAPQIQAEVDDSATVEVASAPEPQPEPTFLELRNVELPAAQTSVRRATHAPATSQRRQSVTRADESDPLAAARRAIESGELAVAENRLQRRLQTFPDDRDARELLIGLMLRGDRTDAAMRQLETGLAYYPAHGTFVLILARLQVERGETGSAMATLRRGAGIRAIRDDCLQMLGALLQQLGRYAEAAETYRQLVTVAPQLGNAWIGLAISLDAQGDLAAADGYRRALVLGGLQAAADSYARQRLAALESSGG